jgi:diguanylate cyclase (GGDEF)-like protein
MTEPFSKHTDNTATASLALTALFAFTHFAWLIFARPEIAGYDLIETILTIAAESFAVLTCFYVAWKLRAERRLWLWWSLGWLVYWIGDVLWAYTKLVLRLDPYPTISDAFYLAQPVFFALGILSLPRARLSSSQALRLTLNIAIITLALGTFLWQFLIAPIISQGGERLPFILSLAYPLADLVVLTLLLFYAARPRGVPMGFALGLLGTGLFLIAVGDTKFSASSLYGDESIPNVYYGAWTMAAFFTAAAAFSRLRSEQHIAPNAPATTDSVLTRGVSEFGPMLAIACVVMLEVFNRSANDLEELGGHIGMASVITLAMVRQALAFRDNARLNSDLRVLSFDLERRVMERTMELSTRERRERERGALLERIALGERIASLRPALDEFGAEDTAGAGVLRALATQRTQLIERLEYNATHDALTGLPNRNALKTWLEAALIPQARLMVMFLDLDGFKRINDTLGHEVGDDLLRAVAERLGEALPKGALLSRTGGDEFVIVQRITGAAESIPSHADRILEALERVFHLVGGEFSISASLGYALYPDHGGDAERLQRHADAAMYTAKDRGRGQIQAFNPEIKAQLELRLEIETQLRQAIAQNELRLHYQPIVDMLSGKLIALEALLRWDNPVLGPMRPDVFIPIAEKSGLILPLSTWVLRHACAQNAAWQRAGFAPVRVTVNLSMLQLEQPDLPEIVEAALLESELSADWLELELVETVLASESAAEKLVALRALGVRLAIDDFGTGYSSLSYLHRLPIDTLKIAQNFTSSLHNDDDRNIQPVLKAILGIARSLDLSVIVEGIETQQQLETLRAMGCDAAQGYLFARNVSSVLAPRAGGVPA